MIPLISHSKEVERPGGLKSCIIDFDVDLTINATNNTNSTFNGTAAQTFTLYTFACSFAIPLCLILIFYCLVILRLKKVGPKNKSKEKKKSHRKVSARYLYLKT